MGQISIDDALQLIQSTRAKDRSDGLDDLKHILTNNRGNSKLGDSGYHKIFETLFRVIRSEKPLYSRAIAVSTKTKAATKLSTCASVLRTAAEVGAQSIKLKTVKAVIDHIIQALPGTKEHFCEPLVSDYLKALRSILSHAPHSEQLPKAEWLELVNFCNEGISAYTLLSEERSSNTVVIDSVDRQANRTNGPTRDSPASSFSDPAKKSVSRSSRNATNPYVSSTLEELVFCIRFLFSASNAPLLEKAQATSTTLFEFLYSSSNFGLVHQAAFMTLNCIISRIITEDVALARWNLKKIVPLVRRHWHTRSASVKEEMLISLIYGRPCLPLLVNIEEVNEVGEIDDCETELQNLLNVLQIEYCKRSEREYLQIDDLLFRGQVVSQNVYLPLSCQTFSLRPEGMKSEPAWAVLEVIASISKALFDQPRSHSPNDDFDPPQKRQKLAEPIGSLLQQLVVSPMLEKQGLLQILTFITDVSQLDAEIMERLLRTLVAYISSDVSGAVNWAMLAASCVACQSASADRAHALLWQQVWRLAARNVTSISSCSAACHLINTLILQQLIDTPQLDEFTDSILASVDLNGPAIFTESAATMWCSLYSSKANRNPSKIHDASERILRWMFTRWNPSKFNDRQKATQLSTHCYANDIIRLLSTILGLPPSHEKRCCVQELGPISRVKYRYIRNQPLLDYLLLRSNAQNETSQMSTTRPSNSVAVSLSDSRFLFLCNMAADFLNSEIAFLLRSYTGTQLGGTSVNSKDFIRIQCCACLVAFGFSSSPRTRDTEKSRQLRDSATLLRSNIASQVGSQIDPQDLADGLYASVGVFLGALDCKSLQDDLLSNGARLMSVSFGQSFWQILKIPKDEDDMMEDEMTVDESLKSRRSHVQPETTINKLSHDELEASTDRRSYEASLKMKMCFAAMMENAASAAESDQSTLPVAFIEFLVSLQPEEFLACRPFLKELFESDIYMDESCGCLVFEYIGKMLQTYQYQRCEVLLGLCLESMISLAGSWTAIGENEISHLGSSLYEWFIKLLERDQLSPHVHFCLSAMLQRVIKARPDYARSQNLPSARTSLFKILNDGNMSVKFNVGMKISEIFGLFVLKEHDAILEDVIQSLPSEADWAEGIALRLFVLSHLGSSWPTLLRRCMYAIFETPGHVPGSADHAKSCLLQLSSALGLESPRNLFKLFVSQIVYTWLEDQSLLNMPFAIFGYKDLPELLTDVQDEVIGQIMMRQMDEEAQQLAQVLVRSQQELLEVSFAKAAAYCIARGAALPPAQDKQKSGAESRLRKLFGKERYAALILQNFAEILALFYTMMDQEDSAQKGFQRRDVYARASQVIEEIVSTGASTVPLPANQQPSFKARFLIDETEFLCRRVGRDPATFWTPALYVFIFRELLNTIHPALGSLHACAVIRKIRVLVSMAGQTALQEYPIEMALHSLRPFLTNTLCAEDGIGIFRYLITNGNTYLEQVPSFVAGLTVSTLASMNSFLKAPQESTTQESQFRATLSRAQDFHTWLCTYAEGYSSPHLTVQTEASFKSMALSASQIQDTGNAKKGTHESDLLLQILKDRQTGSNLIDVPSKDLILGILCAKFEVPGDFRDDILGTDQEAQLYAPTVWDTCRDAVHGLEYLLWAGRVLGRAYCGSGLVESSMLREIRFEHPEKTPSNSHSKTDSGSRSGIIRTLANMIFINDRKIVGLAEITLQRVLSRAEGTELLFDYSRVLPTSLWNSLQWQNFPCPTKPPRSGIVTKPLESIIGDFALAYDVWTQQLCIALVSVVEGDPLLSELRLILNAVPILSERVFIHLLHLVLLQEFDKKQRVRRVISNALPLWFSNYHSNTDRQIKLLLKAIIYLRSQPLPREKTKADRSQWLEFDHKEAAEVATKCQMFKTALLLLEVSLSEVARATRRVSEKRIQQPSDLLLRIYQNLEDRDSFYGIEQPSSLQSMMARLDYENAGFKSLSFRGAYYDSQIKRMAAPDQASEEGIIKVLDTLELNGISQSLLSNLNNAGSTSNDAMLRTARKLERWDIAIPLQYQTPAAIVFKVFQDVHSATSMEAVAQSLNSGFSSSVDTLIARPPVGSSVQTITASLAILVEIEEVLAVRGVEQLKEVWSRFESRGDWMLAGSFDQVTSIASCRETIFSCLSKSTNLQNLTKVSPHDARLMESRALLNSAALNRHHGAPQSALTAATYLAQLVEPCRDVGVKVDAAVSYESANVLWDQGEMSASIKVLQGLLNNLDPRSQNIHVGRPELLAKLGRRISEARLERPDEIIANYLTPAMKELRDSTVGKEAGQVFHEFAFFCDEQLQNKDNLEDYNRVQRLRERKEAEVDDYERMITAASTQTKEKENLRSHQRKARQWLELDDREYRRLRESRQVFLCQSLENYLHSLKACDTYDSDALRFSALWLEHSEDDTSSVAVGKYITEVTSRKFAPLMNQWASRLLDTSSKFQVILAELVYRICIEHPYHGMYQIFASSKSKGGKDDFALSRYAAAQKIVNKLKTHKKIGPIWMSLHNCNVNYARFASERLDESKAKSGSKILLRNITTGQRLEQDAHSWKVPPATMKIPLRADCDYSSIPLITKFQSEFGVASGISMPKILTALASDGRKYKQLFKSGNDDLRQDSIMEQVFEQVSALLQTHRETRQRRLGIRTYKVLPLTPREGIIEFVADTIPLHDYLMPAHSRHFPNDLKTSVARKYISEAQNRSVEQRVNVFRQVCDKFHPVMHFFFMERFENPDDWFEKRLNYTRSTAAISTLGYVLGLGDRHGHNILLDEKTGEVVHIDLGIAFEQGRILPVPEVVPFRLTRDLVDGMGITGTAGVFQRCCEFTLEALRNESYTIMAILDVLRYDPLYSWSLSPLRLAKLQKEAQEAMDATTDGGPVGPTIRGKAGKGAVGNAPEDPGLALENRENEPGEADRALTVVRKKLSKSLSATATVNELIQQATDERNLAVLFCGWAAYA